MNAIDMVSKCMTLSEPTQSSGDVELWTMDDAEYLRQKSRLPILAEEPMGNPEAEWRSIEV